MSSNPKPLIVTAAFLVLMSISGMPKLPALVLASCCGGLALVLTRNQQRAAKIQAAAEREKIDNEQCCSQDAVS